MATQLYSRISHIKQYINQLHQHLNANDHQNATTIITKFKKAVMKNDPAQHANQFLLDCLKTKNQKMLAQLEQLREEKRNMEQIITQKKNKNKNMKQISASIFISRLTVSLNEIKKVEYDEVTINCDYKKITIDSVVGAKYKGYVLNIEGLTKVETKQNYAYMEYMQMQRLNILIKFANEKDMTKWTTCIKFGIMIEASRKRDKLFQPKKESQVESLSSPQYSLHLSPPPTIPLLTFKPTSPSQNVSIIEERKEKSMDKMQKNTERSLVNALSAQRNEKIKKLSMDRDDRSVRDSSFGHRELSQAGFNTRQSKPQHIPKFERNRPSNLRIRGLSENIDNMSEFNISKAYKATDKSRKNSEDNWKPIMNKLYHDQMLKELKTKQVNDDDRMSSISRRGFVERQKEEKKNILGKSIESSQNSSGQKSNKYKTLEQKKMELLKGSAYHKSKIQPPKFNIVGQEKIRWGIQELDQSKSSLGQPIDIRSKRSSIITMSNKESGASNQKVREEDNISQHISEKSQEESPVPPKHKNHALDLPKKISYNDGTILRVVPVESSKDGALSNQGITYEEDIKGQRSQEYSQSQSSQSESHAHSDEDSNQNDTETEDNAARSEELKKGITLTKCAEKGWWPHQKIVYLSQTQNQLCMRDIGDKKIKKIKINSITSVDYKMWDQGIIRHITKIEEDKCLVIRAEMEDKTNKNFQFYGNNAEGLERFSNNLSMFIEYSRR